VTGGVTITSPTSLCAHPAILLLLLQISVEIDLQLESGLWVPSQEGDVQHAIQYWRNRSKGKGVDRRRRRRAGGRL
jgi:hypothetical protein